MPSPIKLERDRLLAERGSLRSLIDGLDGEDVMSRFGLEQRLEEVGAEIAALDVGVDGNASLALFFGGKPVVGQRGIEANFAGAVVKKFQDLVAKIMAEDLVGLGQRGPVPAQDASTMHVTGIVRGSFGFLLEEMSDQAQLVDTALEVAVEKAGRILLAFSSEDENEFEITVGETDNRVVHAVRDIFSLLNTSQATLRYVTSKVDHAFKSGAVGIALERALTTELQEEVVAVQGTPYFLPEGHMFEFRTDDDTLRGRISKEIETNQIVRWDRMYVDQVVHARFSRTTVIKAGEVTRESYKLLGIGEEIGTE